MTNKFPDKKRHDISHPENLLNGALYCLTQTKADGTEWTVGPFTFDTILCHNRKLILQFVVEPQKGPPDEFWWAYWSHVVRVWRYFH